MTGGRAFELARALEEKTRRLFGRSLKLRQVSAGGCNACEADVNVLNTVQAYVQQERLSFGIGVWVLHACVLAVVVLMFARRLFVHGWRPWLYLLQRREAAK